jgi:hypothetical protein
VCVWREKERQKTKEIARERESWGGGSGGGVEDVERTLVDVHSMLMPSSIGGGGFTPDGQTQRK